jgi:cytochrome c oxidase subunit 3
MPHFRDRAAELGFADVARIDPGVRSAMTDDHDSPPHVGNDRFLAHHFDSHEQQFAASRLGMWIFLGTEILLFSGLFCAYAIYRNAHPELFAYGARFLDTGWGFLNTLVLLFSSLTMALAVRSAQLGDQRGLVLNLALTLFCGVDFLGIKAIEYRHKIHENLVWGPGFADDPRGDVNVAPTVANTYVDPSIPDADRGRKLFAGTCSACHGTGGNDGAIKGIQISTSPFVAGNDDASLVAFIKRGRQPNDPLNTTGGTMLPRGGNPNLTDSDLGHIVAYIRLLQERARGKGSGGDGGAVTAPRSPGTDTDAKTTSSPASPKSPAPVREGRTVLDPRRDPSRPANMHIFFGIYFAMTGLHGVHVIAGMCVIAWLLYRARRGDFTRRYFGPVDLGGL